MNSIPNWQGDQLSLIISNNKPALIGSLIYKENNIPIVISKIVTGYIIISEYTNENKNNKELVLVEDMLIKSLFKYDSEDENIEYYNLTFYNALQNLTLTQISFIAF